MTAFDPDPHRAHGATAGTHPESGAHAHDHPPHLAHHFDTPEQQFDTAKIGMWVFLATEILMFGGLFCAYAVYRFNNPDVFRYSEHHLNTWLGATNTVVLLASSLTMALAVRAAQLGQQTYLKLMLAFTMLGAVGFMCIKAVEYAEKFHHGYVPGIYNKYARVDQGQRSQYSGIFSAFAEKESVEETVPAGDGAGEDNEGRRDTDGTAEAPQDDAPSGTAPADQQPPESEAENVDSGRQSPVENLEPPRGERLAYLDPNLRDPNLGTGDAALIRPAFNSPEGLNVVHTFGESANESGHSAVEYTDLSVKERSNVKAFFSIYFAMTGLHGLHVLVGMGLIGWVYVKAAAGTFGPGYFTPVDLVGLYWHLVDLIWIFLFPLLYLIH